MIQGETRADRGMLAFIKFDTNAAALAAIASSPVDFFGQSVTVQEKREMAQGRGSGRSSLQPPRAHSGAYSAYAGGRGTGRGEAAGSNGVGGRGGRGAGTYGAPPSMGTPGGRGGTAGRGGGRGGAPAARSTRQPGGGGGGDLGEDGAPPQGVAA